MEADDESFAKVATRHAEEKDRIGALAAGLVRDRDVVLRDIGTTCAAVARHLRGQDVTVVTASLAVVDELRGDRTVELIVLGGLLRPSYLSMVGTLTQQALAQLSADVAFMGTSGVRPDGTVLDSTGTEVPIKQAIRSASERTCLVATSDKFPGSGLLPVCALSGLDAVVTTAGAETPGLAGVAGVVGEVGAEERAAVAGVEGKVGAGSAGAGAPSRPAGSAGAAGPAGPTGAGTEVLFA